MYFKCNRQKLAFFNQDHYYNYANVYNNFLYPLFVFRILSFGALNASHIARDAMSFKLSPIVELPSTSTDSSAIPDAEPETVFHFAHIAEENFLLVLLLTSRGSLVINYSTNCSSRLESLPIGRLYPHRKFTSQPALVALTEDASVVVLLLDDCNTILLIPFSSLMHVTWGRPATPLVTKPICFRLRNPSPCPFNGDDDESNALTESEISNSKPSAALCYHSRLAKRTYLLFGNKAGSLFLVDLFLKRVSIRIDLCAGIRSMHVHTSQQDAQKQLLITQCDEAQFILPMETEQLPIREAFARINPTDVHCLDERLHFFPQSSVGENASIVCVLDKRDHSLKVFQTLNNTKLTAQTKPEQMVVQLNDMPKNIYQLLFDRYIVILLTVQNHVFLHLRFLQSDLNKSNFVPISYESINNTPIGLISTGSMSPMPLSTADIKLNEDQQKQNASDQLLNTCLLVTKTGLYCMKSEKSMHGIILDHLSAHMFCTDVLTSIAQCLQTSADLLCLSLLNSLLRLHNGINDSVNDTKLTAQVDGLLSLAFIYNVQPRFLLTMLQEYGRAELLLPFLTLKCERNPGDTELRKLLFDAMLARLTRILSEQQKIGTFEEEKRQISVNEQQKQISSDVDALEYEIRHFLIKFDVCETDVLPALLRHSLWSCVCILLSRNPQECSLSVAQFLLELPSWKSVHRIGALLRCIGFLQWDHLDHYAPTLAVKLFNLVPSLDINQLKTVDSIADALIARSIESALSLKLITSMRLFGLTMDANKISHANVKEQQRTENRRYHNLLACGSNCSLVLAEDDIGNNNGTLIGETNLQHNDGTGKTGAKEVESATAQHHPMFWGEFTPGTARLLRDDPQQQQQSTPTNPKPSQTPTASPTVGRKKEALAASSPAKVGLNNAKQQQSTSSRLNSHRQQQQFRETIRKQRENQFPLVPVPRLVQLPSSKVEICSVACGTEHALLLSTDGRMYSWGRNRFGQCGIGHNQPVPTTTEIPWGDWKRPIGVFASHYHSALLTEDNEIWLWGWAVHGQLGIGCIEDKFVPTRCLAFSTMGTIKSICLGYAHSLVLYTDGRVYGCGALAHGQLGIDPASVGNRQKVKLPIQLPFPSQISLLASGFFHGLALAENGKDIFEWGECPQSLKMRMFLQKRLRVKEKQQTHSATSENTVTSTTDEVTQDVEQQENPIRDHNQHKEQTKNTAKSNKSEVVTDIEQHTSTTLLPPTQTQTVIDMPREHLRIRRLCEWKGAPIKALSAGFNHSALLTMDGEVFTWGKALELQLGHGARKERAQPTRLEPKGLLTAVRWSSVVCSRNFTVALSMDGMVYVWGRNDRNELGIGNAQTKKQQQQPIRRILLRTEKGKTQRAVELPADNCVEQPTMLPGLRVPLQDGMEQAAPSESQISILLSSADQHSIFSVSRFLCRHPVHAFVAVHAHLMSGDLLAALRLLIAIAQREQLIDEHGEVARKKKPPLKSNDPEQYADTIGDAQQNEVSVISHVICLDDVDGKNNNKSQTKAISSSTTTTSSTNTMIQAMKKVPLYSSRIGTLKISSNNNNNNNGSAKDFTQQTSHIPLTPRRVAVQMRTIRPKTTTMTTNNGSTKTSPISPKSSIIAGAEANIDLAKSDNNGNGSNTGSLFMVQQHQRQQKTLAKRDESDGDVHAKNQNANLEQFHALVDRVWALLRVHPMREVQTVALVHLLHARFPIYNRLAADVRLCRLVEPFLPLSSPSTTSSSSSSYMLQSRKFLDITVRERSATLRAIPLPDIESRRFRTLRARCEQILAQDRLRYFADCGHFEKCVVESGPMRSELASMRNRMRRCTRCVHSRRSTGSIGAVSEQQQTHSIPAHHKSTS